MPIVGPESEPAHNVVVYFAPDNGAVAKAFATHMRATNNVKVRLIWSSQFRDEQDVLGGIGAIVIQRGAPHEQKIASCYAQWSPETEVHYMTADGKWDEDGTTETDTAPASGIQSAVQTEAEAGTEAPGDDDPVESEAGEGTGSGSVQRNTGAGVESAPATEAGDEEDSREDS